MLSKYRLSKVQVTYLIHHKTFSIEITASGKLMVLVSVLILVICIHLWRKYLLLKKNSIKNYEDFNGDLYHVGHSIVAHVKSTGPSHKTIICMHGWLEDYRYFTQLYSANDGELILINSCDYHAVNKSETMSKDALN